MGVLTAPTSLIVGDCGDWVKGSTQRVLGIMYGVCVCMWYVCVRYSVLFVVCVCEVWCVVCGMYVQYGVCGLCVIHSVCEGVCMWHVWCVLHV